MKDILDELGFRLMKSDSILAKGLSFSISLRWPIHHINIQSFNTGRRIKHHKKYRKYHLSVVFLTSYFGAFLWGVVLLFVWLKRGESALIVLVPAEQRVPLPEKRL